MLKRIIFCLSVSTVVLTTGCSYLLNPYADSPSYRQGEKPSYTALALTNVDAAGCAVNDVKCVYTGKVLLNQPTQNMSFQLYRVENGGMTVVTCASPAEAAKALGTSANVNIALPAAPTASAPAYAASAGSASSEAVHTIQSADAASHYVATAAFESCLAYASGAIDGKAYSDHLQKIYENGVRVAQAPALAASAQK